MSHHVTRIAAVGATAAVAGALAFGFHAGDGASAAQKSSDAWKAEATHWHTVAAQAVRHDRAVLRQNHTLVTRYNQLASDARRANRKLLTALKTANTTRTVTGAQQTIYRTVASSSSAAAPSASAAPAPAPSAPSAPASATS